MEDPHCPQVAFLKGYSRGVGLCLTSLRARRMKLAHMPDWLASKGCTWAAPNRGPKWRVEASSISRTGERHSPAHISTATRRQLHRAKLGMSYATQLGGAEQTSTHSKLLAHTFVGRLLQGHGSQMRRRATCGHLPSGRLSTQACFSRPIPPPVTAGHEFRP
jgi:hypothetical protein